MSRPRRKKPRPENERRPEGTGCLILIVVTVVIVGGGILVDNFGWRNCGLGLVGVVGLIVAVFRGLRRRTAAVGPLLFTTLTVVLGWWLIPEREGEWSVFRRGEMALKWERQLDGLGVDGVETAEFLRASAGHDLGEDSRYHRRVSAAFDRWLERALKDLEAELQSLPEGDGTALVRRAGLRSNFFRFFPDRTGRLRELEGVWFDRSRERLLSEARRREAAGNTNPVAWVAGLGVELGPRMYRTLEGAVKAECLDLVRRGRFSEARRRAESFADVWKGREAGALRSQPLEPWVESYRFLEALARRAGVAPAPGG